MGPNQEREEIQYTHTTLQRSKGKVKLRLPTYDLIPLQSRIQKVLPEGVQLWQRFSSSFFYWWEGRGSKYHNMRANIVPPAKRHLNGVSLACRWWLNIECCLGSLVPFQVIRTSIDMKPYIFVIFQREGSGPPDPLWIRPCLSSEWQKIQLNDFSDSIDTIDIYKGSY